MKLLWGRSKKKGRGVREWWGKKKERKKKEKRSGTWVVGKKRKDKRKNKKKKERERIYNGNRGRRKMGKEDILGVVKKNK